MTNDLLPCPFDHKHELERYITGNGTMVSCCSCGIEIHVDQWNTRDNKTAEVDLDALKREACKWYTAKFDNNEFIGMPSDREVMFGLLDYLHSSGHLATGKGGGDKVTVEVSKLLDIRNALCRDDFFEAYHHLYTLVEWQDPYNAWAEWEKVAPEKKLTPQPAATQPAAPTQIDAGELEIPDGYALVEKEYLRHVGVHADKWLDHLKHVEESVITAPDGLEKDIARLIEVTQLDQMRDEYRLAIKRIIAAARAHLESVRGSK